jgi:hypothetical protein
MFHLDQEVTDRARSRQGMLDDVRVVHVQAQL